MNSEPTTDQMNEAIALFMGYEKYEDRDGKWFKKDGLITALHPKLQELQYHSSWDWLMEVVEKIATLDGGKYNFHISSTGQWACYIDRDDVFDSEITSYGGYEPMIINVYKAVFTFIEWYNKLNNKTTIK